MQLRLASTSGNPTHLRDLLMLVSLNVVQNENLSCSCRQLCDCLVQVHPVSVHGHYRRFLHRCLTTFRLIFNNAASAASFVLSVREDDVHCNSVNPCRESRFSPELRKFFPRPHEYVLRQFFTSHSASTHPRADRE